MSYAYRSSRSSDSRASWLAFSAYVAIAVVLMMSDRSDGIGAKLRLYAAEVLQPVWWMAASPLRAWDASREHLRSRDALIKDNRRLRTQLTLAQTRLADITPRNPGSDPGQQFIAKGATGCRHFIHGQRAAP